LPSAAWAAAFGTRTPATTIAPATAFRHRVSPATPHVVPEPGAE
jgi:hypothetical protein